MKVTINGEVREVPEGLTVRRLLEYIEMRPERVAIERNLEILPRTSWDATTVEASDHFEIVHLVGGGSLAELGRAPAVTVLRAAKIVKD